MGDNIVRTIDLVMLSLPNAQERTAPKFKELFLAADKKLGSRDLVRPRSYRMSILEAVLEGTTLVVIEMLTRWLKTAHWPRLRLTN